MKQHQIIFDKIKALLTQRFGNEINQFEDEDYLTIGYSGIWISCNKMNLTIGYGINCRHYLNEKEFMNQAVDDFFNLLTRKKKTTEFYKGKTSFKIKTEIEGKDGKFTELSTSMTWLYPFWKRTKKKVKIDEKLLEYSAIEKEVSAIRNYVQQNV